MTTDPHDPDADLDLDVAVIGAECRFPGAPDAERFWANLVAGRESVERISVTRFLASGADPELLDDSNLVRAQATVPGVDLFDAEFFGYRKAEAELIDPQQRLFLECAYHLLERAGHAEFPGDTGVYAGGGRSRYFHHHVLPTIPDGIDPIIESSAVIASAPSSLATRVAYDLGLTGPALTVQTACSTSLVATHLAYQDLVGYRCDLALAGGVTLNPDPDRGYLYVEDGPFAPDGHCRPFDAAAAGMVPGDGVGIVLLKRLADALADGDEVLAVIKGTAVNNDGRRKVGFAAPSPHGQADVVAAAHAAAGVTADSIGLVEAHGTGTPVGDPIEVAALTRAFRRSTDRTGFCALGSVKGNVGHLDTAAGVAGLIKAVFAVRHGIIPASINLDTPNPLLELETTPFLVNRGTVPWPAGDTPRRAGVSSFGVGGTNAHVVVEQPPPPSPADPPAPMSVLTVSARTASALRAAATGLAGHLAAHPELNPGDVAATLQLDRPAMTHRVAVTCTDVADGAERLRAVSTGATAPDQPRPVVFMFPGGGAQYDGMGRELYSREPVFRDAVDRCADVLGPLTGRDLRTVLYDDGSRAVHGDHTHHLDGTATGGTSMVSAALVATEYALATWLGSVGVSATAMIGHSLGEYTCACLSGVLRLEDALRLVVEREQLFVAAGGTTMSVSLPEDEVVELLTEELSLAAVNGPSSCTVAGPTAAVTALAAVLDERGVQYHQVRIPTAAHSSVLRPHIGPFERSLRDTAFGVPEVPYVSNVTGTWVTPAQAADPGHWLAHSLSTVRFAAGLTEVAARGEAVLLEVGPGAGLGKLARRQLGENTLTAAIMRHAYADESDLRFLHGALGRLWECGVPVDWTAVHAGRRRRRVRLPGYPFERRRYWIEAAARPRPAPTAPEPEVPVPTESGLPDRPPLSTENGLAARPPLSTDYVAPRSDLERMIADLWIAALGVEGIGVDDNFFDLGGESLLIMQVIAGVRKATGVSLSARQLFISHRLTIAGFAQEIEENTRATTTATVT